MAKSKKSLAETHPELVKEWHPTKNGILIPEMVTHGTDKRVWWKCCEGPDHEWQTAVGNRTNGKACPFCTGKRVSITNSLATLDPDLASQWHPEKNSELLPSHVTTRSGKKVWWKCNKGEDHEWQSRIADRSSGKNCPVCSGHKIVLSNCLATLEPELTKQWHPTKNNNLTPFDVSPGSGKKVWWKCNKGDDHEWVSSISSKTLGRGCPICRNYVAVKSNCLAEVKPQLAQEWHPTKNGRITPSDVTPFYSKKVWWKCNKGEDHEWQASVDSRRTGNGCPVCSGHKIVLSNCLATLEPELTKQWHPTKNNNLTPFDVSPGSGKKVWWKCNEEDDHEWRVSVHNRTYGSGCPVCIGKKVTPSNCLANTNAVLAKQWHPTKNGDLTPYDITSGSNLLVWWKCDEDVDHEWESTINNRNRGTGCPICIGQITVTSNSLANINPELANEWHPTKNNDLSPFHVTRSSDKKVWWKCRYGEDHEWQAAVKNRSNGNKCPFCNLTPQSRQELTINFELKIFFKQIAPTGFKTYLDGKLRAIDIFIPKLNLCIEFDGAYWHKNKREIDKIKSNLLLKEGYSVIRVREEPLKKIHDTDVISKQPYNGKQVTDDVLSMILSMYDLDSELAQRIKDYQSKGELQNEKGLNRYIDKILKEKAEKK